MARSLINTALFLAVVGGLALVCAALIRDPGQVSIEWGGRVAELHASTLLAGVVAAFVFLWLLASLIAALLELPALVGGYARRKRQARGLEFLGRALTAYAAEDGTAALSNARRAERLLANPRLTRSLMAKSLDMEGKAAEARRYYEALANNRETAAAGVRGLLAAALRDGNEEEAAAQARRAIELEPRNPVALAALLKLQVSNEEWSQARRTVRNLVQARVIARDEGRRKEAALYASEALAVEASGDGEQALALAVRAAEIDAGLTPAAAAAARLSAAMGERRRADRFLLQAWKRSPMPELAALWMQIGEWPDHEDRQQRLKRLVNANPMHSESRLLMAEAAIAQRDRAAVLDALEPMHEDAGPEARYCAAMAAVERWAPDGADNARLWLAKALAAPRGRGWQCDSCGAQSAAWSVTCTHCGELASLSSALLDVGGETALQAPSLPKLQEWHQEDDEAAEDIAPTLPEAPSPDPPEDVSPASPPVDVSPAPPDDAAPAPKVELAPASMPKEPAPAAMKAVRPAPSEERWKKVDLATPLHPPPARPENPSPAAPPIVVRPDA